MLRRLLLVVVVGLVVAWPVVPNEDPGLLSERTEPLGIILTMCTLAAAVAWAAWRSWSGYHTIRIGLVEVALAVFVVLAFVGVSSASYKRAAWLAAWSWVGIAFLCFLVRQLLVRPEEQHALYGVLLSLAVALSVQSFYQTLVELPQDYKQLQKKERAADLIEQKKAFTEEEQAVVRQTALGREASATFFHPAGLAGVLLLLLPGLVGATIACFQAGARRWQTLLVGVGAVLALIALYLTRQPLAVVVLLIVGVGVVLLSALGRQNSEGGRMSQKRNGDRRLFLLSSFILHPSSFILPLGLAVLAAVSFGLYQLKWIGTLPDATLQDRWSVAQQTIGRHPGFGVGGSLFALQYPHLRAPLSGPRGVEAGNFLLQIGAEFGLPALLVLVFGLVVFFVRMSRPQVSSPVEHNDLPILRWEFLVGGSVGVGLSFFLRAGSLPQPNVLGEAIAAGLRVVVWFAAMAFFERIPWWEKEFRVSLIAGVAGLLLYLLVSDGIGWPSLVGMLAIVLGLGLAGSSEGWSLGSRVVARYLPLPVLTALVLLYFCFVLYPTTTTTWAINQARTRGHAFLVNKSRKPEERTIKDPAAFLAQKVLQPLREAEQTDSDNSTLYRMLADANENLWSLDPLNEKNQIFADRALYYVRKASKVNPLSPEGDVMEHQLYLTFASYQEGWGQVLLGELNNPRNQFTPGDRAQRQRVAAEKMIRGKENRTYAIQALVRAVGKDPNNLPLHHRLEELWSRQGETQRAREEARIVLKLNEQVRPELRLTETQRERLQKLVGQESSR